MMTEDEAKKKWCPHVQVSVSTGIDGTEADDNRNSTKHDFDRQPVCIGSACMAWRWKAQQQLPIDEGLAPSHEGYCGLAGQP
jgi:hypothetical protein